MTELDTSTALGFVLDWLVTVFPATNTSDIVLRPAAVGFAGLYLVALGFTAAAIGRFPSPGTTFAPALVASIVSTLTLLFADGYLAINNLPRISWTALKVVPTFAAVAVLAHTAIAILLGVLEALCQALTDARVFPRFAARLRHWGIRMPPRDAMPPVKKGDGS